MPLLIMTIMMITELKEDEHLATGSLGWEGESLVSETC